MRQMMETLTALQDLLLKEGLSVEAPKVKKLRSEVPEQILGHFDRLIARGKKGVALVRAGVCSECHMKLSTGTMGSIQHAEEIHLCDNCGRYLFLVEPVAAPAPAPVAKPARKRKAAAAPAVQVA